MRLVTSAGVGHGDLVLDIGAGTGVVTDALIGTGAKVIAVELHRQRVLELRARYEGARVTVVQADAANLRLPRRPFTVVANPPFAVLHHLVRRLLAPGTRLTAAYLVVPRYVAELWTGPKAPGGQRWRQEFSVYSGWALPRAAFVPPPPRPAVVLVLQRAHDSAAATRGTQST